MTRSMAAKSTAAMRAKSPADGDDFLFLLVANWVKLVPGAESVGLMHCAAEGINGYERNGIILKVDKAMDAGTRATAADYDACHHAEADEHAADEAADPGEGVEGEQSAMSGWGQPTPPGDDLSA